MKAQLKIQKPRSGTSYSPLEEVRGLLDLEASASEIRCAIGVDIYFKGDSKITFTARAGVDSTGQFPEPKLRKQASKLFEQVQAVPLSEGMFSAGDDVTKRLSRIPFTFAFPRGGPCSCQSPKTRCHHHHLPPSLAVRLAGMKARVTYFIVARIRRSGILHIRDLKVRQELLYSSTSAAGITPASPPSRGLPFLIQSTATLPASRLGLPSNELLYPGCLPPYSPALILELLMANPPLLVCGKPFSIRVLVHSPRPLFDFTGDICVRSLVVSLKSRTTGQVGATVRTVTSQSLLRSVKGSIPLESEKTELDCGLWQDCNAPLSIPTFESCHLSQDYAVEAVLGLHSERETKIQYVEAALEVLLVQPPPAYS